MSKRRTPNNDLHELIQSLTGTERRFFKVSASRYEGKKKYLELFDAIAEQDQYDEEKIREKFSGEQFLNQLSSAKHYLYHLILKSLRDFHQPQERKIHDIQHDASILTDKGLYPQAAKALKRGLALAKKVDDFTGITEISASQWNMMMDHAKSIEEFEQKGGKALQEARNGLELRSQLLTLVELNTQLSIYRTTAHENLHSPSVRQKFYRNILEHPALADHIQHQSKRLASYYHLVRGSCYQYLDEFEKAWEEKSTLVAICAEILKQKPSSLKNYLSAARNCANAAMGLKKLQELERLVEGMRLVSSNIRLSTKQKALLAGDTATIELQRLFLNDRRQATEGIPHWISEALHQYGSYLRSSTLFHLRFIASAILSLRKRHPDVLEWSSPALKAPLSNEFADRYRDLQLMRMIALYELEEIDLLESQLRSHKRAYRTIPRKRYQETAFEVLQKLQDGGASTTNQTVVQNIIEDWYNTEDPAALNRGQRNPIHFWLRTIVNR